MVRKNLGELKKEDANWRSKKNRASRERMQEDEGVITGPGNAGVRNPGRGKRETTEKDPSLGDDARRRTVNWKRTSIMIYGRITDHIPPT